jgi:hypothetical protein
MRASSHNRGMRLAAVIPFAFLACAAHAQHAESVWLDSKPAADFRARVVQLALIYGESSGLDLRDYMVRATSVSKEIEGCADVEVVVSKGERVVRRDAVRACHVPRSRPSPG